MKQRYRADRLRTTADGNNIIALWKKIIVFDVIYGISWAWSSMNPVTLLLSWRKLVPDLEDDDLQGFRNEEISKSEILDMDCAVRSLKNGRRQC
jgi:hypothetical protein